MGTDPDYVGRHLATTEHGRLVGTHAGAYMNAFGTLANTALSFSAVRSLVTRLLRRGGVILRLHRLSDPAVGVVDRETEGIRRVLEFLRAERHELIALDEMISRLKGDGPPLDRTIAVTIDDGYYDQVAIGAPLFAAYDCPVTTFVATGFLDGELWFWWDKVKYVFRHTPRREIRLDVASQEIAYTLLEAGDRKSAAMDFTERAKRVPQEEKESALERLAAVAEIEIPQRPPQLFAPMTWDQVRACEKNGMTFGPHTVTHPILARASDEQCRREIEVSWERLQAEVDRPVPVFCYPNGQPEDFGPREIEILRETGFAAAVTTVPGYNLAATFQANLEDRFALRRFGNIDSLPNVIRFVSGADRVRLALTRISR